MEQPTNEAPQPKRWFDSLRNGFAIVGLFTVSFLVLEVAIVTHRMPPAITEALAEAVQLDAKEPALQGAAVTVRAVDPKQQAIARHLSRTYRIAVEAADEVVMAAFESAKKLGLDPLVLLAVIAVESRFNPIAESEMGAKGLMQVIPKYHLDKLGMVGGQEAVLDPWINVLVGAQILKEYVTRAGSLEAGLQWYNGAPNDENRVYAEKVLAEKERLAQAVVPGRRAAPAPAAALPASRTVPAAPAPSTSSSDPSQTPI